jgi:hypothetical protein
MEDPRQLQKRASNCNNFLLERISVICIIVNVFVQLSSLTFNITQHVSQLQLQSPQVPVSQLKQNETIQTKKCNKN